KRIQIRNPIVGSAGLHHARLVLNHHRAAELRAKPKRTTRGHIDGQYAAARRHCTGLLQFAAPTRESAAKVLGEQNRPLYKRRARRRRGESARKYANADDRATPHDQLQYPSAHAFMKGVRPAVILWVAGFI